MKLWWSGGGTGRREGQSVERASEAHAPAAMTPAQPPPPDPEGKQQPPPPRQPASLPKVLSIRAPWHILVRLQQQSREALAARVWPQCACICLCYRPRTIPRPCSAPTAKSPPPPPGQRHSPRKLHPTSSRSTALSRLAHFSSRAL